MLQRNWNSIILSFPQNSYNPIFFRDWNESHRYTKFVFHSHLCNSNNNNTRMLFIYKKNKRASSIFLSSNAFKQTLIIRAIAHRPLNCSSHPTSSQKKLLLLKATSTQHPLDDLERSPTSFQLARCVCRFRTNFRQIGLFFSSYGNSRVCIILFLLRVVRWTE